jgi:hypothetical protein
MNIADEWRYNKDTVYRVPQHTYTTKTDSNVRHMVDIFFGFKLKVRLPI